MSPLLWLQRLFERPSESEEGIPPLEDSTPFVFTQHMRIVLAILVCIFSAFVIWWILA